MSAKNVLELYVEKAAFDRVDTDSVMVAQRDQALRQLVVMQSMATRISQVELGHDLALMIKDYEFFFLVGEE